MADTVYVVDDYIDAGYFVYTADAGAGLSTTSYLPYPNYFEDNYIQFNYVEGGLYATANRPATATMSGVSSTSITATKQVIAEATVTAIATLDASTRRTRTVSESLTSTATVSATATRTRTVSQNLSSTATVSATVIRQRQDSKNLTSTCTLSVSVEITKSTGASLTAFDTISVVTQANKNFSGNLAGEFSLSAQASVTRDAGYPTATVTWDSQDSSWDDWQHLYWDPDNGIWIRSTSSIYAFPIVTGDRQHLLNSEFSIYPNGGHHRQALASLVENAASVFTIGGYVKTTGGIANAQSTLTVPGEKLHSTTGSNISANFSIGIQADAIPPTRGIANLQSQFTIYPNGGPFVLGSSTLNSEFSIQALGKTPGLQDARASITAQSTNSITPLRIAGGQSTVSTIATSSATSIRIRRITDNLSSQFAQNTTVIRTRPGASVLNTVASYSVTSTRVKRSGADVNIIANLDALAGKLKIIGSNPIAVATMPLALGGIRVGAQANLIAQGFTLQAGDVYWFDSDLVLKVASENRWYAVLTESRLLTATEETRVNMVLDELRTLDVPEETRSLQVIA